jgi:hypothetical protein
VPQGNGIRGSEDLRARFRKFLNLTNERKKMSKTTLRKRIALVAVSAITAGLLSVVSAPVASAARQTSHTNAGGTTNDATLSGTLNGSMFTSVVASTGTSAAVPSNGNGTDATQKGLLNKDSSSGTAQTATILAGGQVALYAPVSTASAFTATGGSFSGAAFIDALGETVVYGSSNSSVLITSTTGGGALAAVATTVAVLWTAPTTPGSYTVSLLTGFNTSSTSTVVVPTIDTLPPTLSGSMLVTVVAASAGGTYSASRSACSVQDAGSSTEYSSSVPATDSTTTYVDGTSAYIAFDLNDAYTQNLATGSIVVTATNGAFVNIATGTTLLAGTSSTAILSSDGAIDNVRVSQPTAGAPVTTTVTITYNGTAVCTKTITIRGAVAKLTIGNIGTQALSAASDVNGSQWMYQKTGIFTPGQFTVLATDSAGNLVSTTSALGSYSAASGIGTQIVSATVNRRSASNDSSTPLAYNYGGFGCGSAAGQASIAIKFTDAATGKVTTSDAFTARCADTAVTYAVSLDKGSYLQGDVAKATVQFLDSKGNKANNMVAIGANSWILPYMTAVDSTITSTTGASAVSVTGADGSVVYTFTVGTTTAAVAGTYTGVVSFTSPALGVNQTPTYKLSTGGDTTSNADVLKSIVALIASINKQIQALQKLILKR